MCSHFGPSCYYPSLCFQAEDGIRGGHVTGVQTCALPIYPSYETGNGGTPPALVLMKDGRLALAYIYRSNFGSRVHLRLSDDQGKTWSNEITVRSGDHATRDVGYPRMVQREDRSEEHTSELQSRGQ